MSLVHIQSVRTNYFVLIAVQKWFLGPSVIRLKILSAWWVRFWKLRRDQFLRSGLWLCLILITISNGQIPQCLLLSENIDVLSLIFLCLINRIFIPVWTEFGTSLRFLAKNYVYCSNAFCFWWGVTVSSVV